MEIAFETWPPDVPLQVGVGYRELAGILAAIVVIAGYVLLTRMPYGQYITGIGANAEAVRRAGVNIRKHILSVYVLSGAAAAIAGIVVAARLGSGSANAAVGFELQVIAAVVLGGTNLFGGRGTIVGRGVTVENFCKVGRYCKLESECYITAYSELADRVFVAPGVVTSNDNYVGRTNERFKHFKGVTVGRGGRIGAGSVILPGISIGADGLVAAGSVVTRDVPDRTIVMGSPAKSWREVPEEQLLDNQGWVDG